MAIRIRDPDPDPNPYRNTGKTCVGGGMHCPSASSFITVLLCLGLMKSIMISLRSIDRIGELEMMIAPPSFLQASPVETIVRSSFLGACVIIDGPCGPLHRRVSAAAAYHYTGLSSLDVCQCLSGDTAQKCVYP